MSPADLYDRDFYEWTVRNAELLRSGRATEADLEHIAEEIEDMGKREQRELYSRLKVLIAHLLKWQVQPDRRGSSWESTILVQRRDLKRLLAQNPSLKPHLAELTEGGLLRRGTGSHGPDFAPRIGFSQ
jgi:hypothetical protein